MYTHAVIRIRPKLPSPSPERLFILHHTPTQPPSHKVQETQVAFFYLASLRMELQILIFTRSRNLSCQSPCLPWQFLFDWLLDVAAPIFIWFLPQHIFVCGSQSCYIIFWAPSLWKKKACINIQAANLYILEPIWRRDSLRQRLNGFRCNLFLWKGVVIKIYDPIYRA